MEAPNAVSNKKYPFRFNEREIAIYRVFIKAESIKQLPYFFRFAALYVNIEANEVEYSYLKFCEVENNARIIAK